MKWLGNPHSLRFRILAATLLLCAAALVVVNVVAVAAVRSSLLAGVDAQLRQVPR